MMLGPDGAIQLDEETIEMLARDRSYEMMRAWITHNGPSTIIINAYTLPPSQFGMLLADCARHASKAYAAADGSLSERDARQHILESLWRELADPSTDLDTVCPGGRNN